MFIQKFSHMLQAVPSIPSIRMEDESDVSGGQICGASCAETCSASCGVSCGVTN